MRRFAQISVTVTLILALVGVADAAIENVWDLFVLFLTIAALQVVILLVSASSRFQVSMRPDLAQWATQRSQRTGESIEDIVDRALAWYQHGLYQPTDRGSDPTRSAAEFEDTIDAG